jgi:hypothetical protein
LPIPIVVLAVLLGGTAIELLWAHGVLVALLGAPVIASAGTAAVILAVLSWQRLSLSARRNDFIDLRTTLSERPANGRSRML